MTQSLPIARKAASPPSSTAAPAAVDTGQTDQILSDMFDFQDGGFARAADLASAGEVPHRAQMEAGFGIDLGHVRAYTGQESAMASIGATAAARGDEIAFAETAPSPWLVAHELTHVVQHGAAGAAPVSRAAIAPVDSAAEREADQVADRVASGQPAGPIVATPEAAIHRFAPSHHEAATAGGLAGTFSPGEIGVIYGANWERDFSQAHPVFADLVIAWKAVKQHAATHGGAPGPAARSFRDAAVVAANLSFDEATTSECLGGYQAWEHMDQPGALAKMEADVRWLADDSKLAGYLLDSRAYIMDQMVAAVDVYRLHAGRERAGGHIDNWKGGQRPDEYKTPELTREGDKVVTTIAPDWNDTDVASRAPVRADAAATAEAEGAAPAGDPGAVWELVGQHLGRAMHAFEDFWAHSNWIELAAYVERAGDSEFLPAVDDSLLETGTFGDWDKKHALGHKLVAASDALLADFDLLERVYGRSRSEPAALAGGKMIGGSVNAAPGGITAAGTPLYELVDETVLAGAGGILTESFVLGSEVTHAEVEEFLCNREHLRTLRARGENLIELGDHMTEEHGHGKLAKDQHEEGKAHGAAMVLATAANERVFGPLRAIMDESDPARAIAAIEQQLALVDAMLQAPSTTHPLWDVFAGR